jgi:hypothetical protein
VENKTMRGQSLGEHPAARRAGHRAELDGEEEASQGRRINVVGGVEDPDRGDAIALEQAMRPALRGGGPKLRSRGPARLARKRILRFVKDDGNTVYASWKQGGGEFRS